MQSGIEAGGPALFKPRELLLRVSFPDPAMYWTFRYLTTNDLSDVGFWPRNNTVGTQGLDNLLRAFQDNGRLEFPPNTSLSVRKVSNTVSRVLFAVEVVLEFTMVFIDTLFLYLAHFYVRFATYTCSEIVKDR